MSTRTPAHDRDFGWAVRAMKNGEKVARVGWNGKGMHLELNVGAVDSDGREIEGFFVLKTVDGLHVAWTASQTDLRAEDWMLV